MDGLQRSDMVIRQLIPYDYDEIDIAVSIKIADSERTLQIHTDERVRQRCLNRGGEILQDRPELRERCWLIRHSPSRQSARPTFNIARVLRFGKSR
jgi:hypothetical protein